VIRVCVVAPAYSIGGQAVEARTLVNGFADDAVACVELQPIDPVIPAWLARIRGVRTLARMPLFYSGLIRRILRCDVVHVFTAAFWPFVLTTTPAVLLGRLLGRPVILNYRDGRAREHIRYRPVRWVLRCATALVFPSGFLREMFAEFGLEGIVISNVVDTSRFCYRERNALRPILLSPRALERLYAVENTILAFEEVRRCLPGARLIVVGDGEQRTVLEALVAERVIGGVEFVGLVTHDTMGEWFNRADIMVNSSRIDNMPHCLIEAFSAGLPVVTTPAGGIPWIVQHGENGLHVPADDPHAMAEAVIRLVNEPELASRLVAGGLDACRRNYSWAAVRQQWTALYRQLATPFRVCGGLGAKAERA
jgi:glycosyltransferase involved in cell wall biosynthesis